MLSVTSSRAFVRPIFGLYLYFQVFLLPISMSIRANAPRSPPLSGPLGSPVTSQELVDGVFGSREVDDRVSQCATDGQPSQHVSHGSPARNGEDLQTVQGVFRDVGPTALDSDGIETQHVDFFHSSDGYGLSDWEHIQDAGDTLWDTDYSPRFRDQGDEELLRLGRDDESGRELCTEQLGQDVQTQFDFSWFQFAWFWSRQQQLGTWYKSSKVFLGN